LAGRVATLRLGKAGSPPARFLVIRDLKFFEFTSIELMIAPDVTSGGLTRCDGRIRGQLFWSAVERASPSVLGGDTLLAGNGPCHGSTTVIFL